MYPFTGRQGNIPEHFDSDFWKVRSGNYHITEKLAKKLTGKEFSYLRSNDALVIMSDGRGVHSHDHDYHIVVPRPKRDQPSHEWLAARAPGKRVVHENRLCKVVHGPCYIHGKWSVRIRPMRMQEGEGTSFWLRCQDVQPFNPELHADAI